MSLEGRQLGEFTILSRIGQGGMGAVYKARQTSLDRLVALKTLQTALAEDAEYIGRFRQEAKAAARLNHPNLVQVYAAGETDGLHWFAMEYVEGESAKGRLQCKGRLDPLEAIAIVIPIATALEYGWKKAQLIHRDIKPDNIFLSIDDEVKLGDLGLAKSVGQSQELTMTGKTAGTPHYISPEQVQEMKTVDFRADIYSLGCTLYHFLSGRAPYEGNNPVTIMMKHVTAPVPDLREAWPECPEDLAAVVKKMMLKSPEERPRSYGEVIAGLRRVYDQLSGPQEVAVTPPPPAVAVAPQPGVEDGRPSPRNVEEDNPINSVGVDDRPTEPRGRDRGPTKPIGVDDCPTMPRDEGGRPTKPVGEDDWPTKPVGEDEYPTKPVGEDDRPRQPVVQNGRSTKLYTGIGAGVLALAAAAFFVFHPKEEKLTQAQLDAPEHAGAVAGVNDPGGPASLRPATTASPQPASAPGESLLAKAPREAPFVNTLGMKFVPVPIPGGPSAGQRVLFSIWDTRVKDYAVYAAANPKVDSEWKHADVSRTPVGRKPDHPVVCVSWEDAQAFCQWLTQKEQAEGKLPKRVNYRLPTDEEWSWAVGLPPESGATPAEKDGKNRVDFPWGKDWPPRSKVGNYADETYHAFLPDSPYSWLNGYTDGYATTSPVGSFPANAYGLYDMGGNVCQWCEDWFDATHKERVLRGASWDAGIRDLLISSPRFRAAPSDRFNYGGFRCVVGASAL